MSIAKSCMLVKLTIKSWDGFKKDQRVSDRVDVDFKTAGGAGNYNKRLLDRSTLQPIHNLSNKIRTKHRDLTHPWLYDGVSLLPGKLYLTYTEALRSLRDQFDAAVENLVTQYPIYVSNQSTVLGDLFDPKDYPAQYEIRSRFSVDFDFFPVPQEDHFVFEHEQLEADKIKRDLTKSLQSAHDKALGTLYDRVGEVIERVHERLADPGNIFRDSLIENLQSLVLTLPGLNVFNDERLEHVCREIKEKLLITSADRLREDPEVRKQVAESAFDIAALLRGEEQLRKAA